MAYDHALRKQVMDEALMISDIIKPFVRIVNIVRIIFFFIVQCQRVVRVAGS